jgi:phenylalanyl-tRNA synthetase beta chain
MSVDLSVMRVNLLPGLIDALSANVSRQQDRVQLFEHGLIFVPGEELVQEERVGLLRWGRRAQESWNQPDAKVDFFDLKGDVERLLSWSGLREVTFEPINGPLLHPGQSARIVASGATIGLLGRLHPEIEARLDTVEGIFVAEFAASALLSRTSRTYNKLSKFPSVRRDLSLLVPAETPAQQLESLVRQALGDILIEFTLFDLYQGKGIDSTEKSVGLGLTLQHPSATLTDEEIGHYVDNALSALTAAVGARLR